MSDCIVLINSFGKFARVSRETFAALMERDNTEIAGLEGEAVQRMGVRVANPEELKVYHKRQAAQAKRHKEVEAQRRANKLKIHVVTDEADDVEVVEQAESKPKRTRKKTAPKQADEVVE